MDGAKKEEKQRAVEQYSHQYDPETVSLFPLFQKTRRTSSHHENKRLYESDQETLPHDRRLEYDLG